VFCFHLYIPTSFISFSNIDTSHSSLRSKCIALNDKWAKGHVRLASAYIALGGHSNDACQSLQRALALDRSNKFARELLVKELRRRDTGCSNNGESSTDEGEGRNATESSQTQQSSSYTNNDSSADDIDIDDVNTPSSDHYNSLPFRERVQFHFAQIVSWYHSQSEDIKTLVKVSFCFLILYFALGGRFGFEYALGNNNRTGLGRRGNYGSGNAYERYQNGQASSPRRDSTASSPGYNDRYSGNNDRYYDRYADTGFGSADATHRRQQESTNTNSYGSGSGPQRTATTSGYNDRSNSQNDRYYSRYENDAYYERPRTRSNTTFQMVSQSVCGFLLCRCKSTA
jgi:hypothetical protein